MKAEILKMLREADGYISGQEICEKFNVSRTAVWKVIRRLQEDGYEVEAVRNKGYRMVESPDILTKEEVESCMHTEWAGRNVVCYKVTDSTNLRIKQMGDEGALAGTLAVAEEQTAGRGRRGRSWESPAGAGIFMSVLLRPKITPDKASMLTIVTACSTAKGIKNILKMRELPVRIFRLSGRTISLSTGKTGRYSHGDEYADRLYQLCDRRDRN